MKFTKYNLMLFLFTVILITIFNLIFCLTLLKRNGDGDFWIIPLEVGIAIVVYFFLSQTFRSYGSNFVPIICFAMSGILIVGTIIDIFYKKNYDSRFTIAMPFSVFTASFYWLFIRPKEKQAEENKKSAEDKKIEENKLAEENKKLESAKKSEIKMKRHLLFFIPIFVLCPLSNFLLQNEMFSVSQLMILTAGQYIGYFLSTLFFFITKKFSSPQRLKQHIVTTFVIGTIGMIWVLSDNFFRQSAGIGFFIAVLCSALSWYTKDLKGISIINKK